MLKVSDIDKIQKQYENVTEKIISLREEVSESRNDTETEYVSVEDVLDTQETPSNETNLVLIAPGPDEEPVSILSDEF